AKAIACGADAAMLGAPLAAATESPGQGLYWTPAAAHPSLPRSAVAPVAEPHVDLSTLLTGPSSDPSGAVKLFGALRRVLDKTGDSNLKEFQKVELPVHAWGESGAAGLTRE